MNFIRYAIYYTPPPGSLATFGARWLGWDIARGCAVDQTATDALPVSIEKLTRRPRKYGFHATLVPPFRLGDDQTLKELKTACGTLAGTLKPVTVDGLELSQVGQFWALTVRGEVALISELAAASVQALDPFRASLDAQTLARRRRARLSPHQDALLLRWGYPYVMDEFRFHMTLTGPVNADDSCHIKRVLTTLTADVLPAPFIIDDLTLVGEDAEGMFHEITRFPLGL